MDREAIERRVHEVLNAFTDCEGNTLTATMDLKRDLGLDEFDVPALAMELEDAFDLELITDAEIAAVATVGDLVTLIAKQKGSEPCDVTQPD